MSGIITRACVRAFSTEALNVINNAAKQQFTVTFYGVEAILDYEEKEKHIIFKHTTVPEAFQGKGVGKLLAEYAFDHAEKNKLNVTCKCDFLAMFYDNNKNKYKGLNVKLALED